MTENGRGGSTEKVYKKAAHKLGGSNNYLFMKNF